MINLLKNEFIKAYKRKGILITLIIMVGYALLTNFIYSQMDNIFGMLDEAYYTDISKDDYEINTKDGLKFYVNDKSISDIQALRKEYDKGSWQHNYITEERFFEMFNIINSYENKLSDDEEEYNEAKKQYNSLLENLKKDDWKTLVKEENKIIKENIKKLKSSDFDNTVYIKELEIQLESNNFRLDKNIPYGNDHKNNNLDTYINYKKELLMYEGKDVDKLSNLEKEAYYQSRETYLSAEYSLKNDLNTESYNTSYAIFRNFFNEYFLMLSIIIFMIAGSITSQEHNKGTIKLLLLRPYSRIKILLSKYLISLSSILIGFVIMALIQLVVGGLILDFESLSQPVLIYNVYSDSLQVYNLFEYVILTFISLLPMLIILTTFAFAISTITTNTALGVISGFVLYIGGNIFSALAMNLNNWLKDILIMFHWDLSSYIFNKLPIIDNCNIGISLLVCLIYFLIMIIPTFIVFKRRDIKND